MTVSNTPSIQLLNIDCMEYMATLPDKAFELAIVDPPYGIGVSNKKHYGRRSHAKAVHSKTGSGYNVRRNNYSVKSWDNSIPTIKYFLELKRVSKNQIIWGWNYYKIDWGTGSIKWNKMQPNGVSFGQYEYAYCSLLDRQIEFKFMWAGMMQGKSLNDPETQQGNKSLNERRIHPTQKPIALYRWLLHNYAKPGDRILDTHLGSASSAIAAHQMGFEFVGCELDKDYYDASIKRFKEQTKQLSLL